MDKKSFSKWIDNKKNAVKYIQYCVQVNLITIHVNYSDMVSHSSNDKFTVVN